MDKTIFEKIVAREIPSYIIYEDDLVLSFLDISQATKGHSLVISKKPYKNIFEIPEETLSHLMIVVKRLTTTITKAFNADGVNILNNNESYAGQTVFHFHVHIIPRYKNDNLGLVLRNNMNTISKDEFTQIQNKIISEQS